MTKERLTLGRSGECLAEEFLKNNGYKIIARNYRKKFGEVDLIAKDKDTLCFIEVKTRSSQSKGLPQESVTKDKQCRISKAAVCYLQENKLFDCNARFDVLAVLCDGNPAKFDLIKNAFELDERFTV